MAENEYMGIPSYTPDTVIAEAPTEPVTPIQETPAAETTPPPAETTPTEVTPAEAKIEPQVVEKIVEVEKIIEKFPEFKDDYSKTLYERLLEGDDDTLYSYLSEKKKDYRTMSDLDVVKEGLTKKNPQWSKDDVDLEIRSVYGNQLEKYDLSTIDKDIDPEGFKEAEQHNRQADANLLKLQRDARDNRIYLIDNQKTIELPKIQKQEAKEQAPQDAAEQAAKADELKRMWASSAEQQVPNMTDFKFSVGDDKNPEELVFKVTDEDKRSQVEAMKTWTGTDFMSKRGWLDDKGEFNLLKIAEDVYALENQSKFVKSAYSQGVTSGKKDATIDIKNIDLSNNRSETTTPVTVDAGRSYWN